MTAGKRDHDRGGYGHYHDREAGGFGYHARNDHRGDHRGQHYRTDHHSSYGSRPPDDRYVLVQMEPIIIEIMIWGRGQQPR